MVSPCACVDARGFGIVAYVYIGVFVWWRLGVLFSETMRSVLFVAVSFCILRDAAAFSPAAPVAVGANLRATANTARGRRIRSAMRPVLSMAGEQPQQVIDFGKVGFSEADNQVFTWPALSHGHTLSPLHAVCRRVAIPSCSSFQNSEPPWWRGQLLPTISSQDKPSYHSQCNIL